MYSLPLYENAANSAPFLSFKVRAACNCLDSFEIYASILAGHIISPLKCQVRDDERLLTQESIFSYSTLVSIVK